MPRLPAPKTAYHHLAQTLRDLETDLRWGLEGSPRIPADWHRIAQEVGPPPKKQITLRLDEDVWRFFRSMGGGHLTRMNAVLRAFMLARLAEVVKAEDFTPTHADEVHQIREEITALMTAHAAAKAAALAEMSEVDRRKTQLQALRTLRDQRVRGDSG
ncbi:hypothetical protein MASR2M74_36430 [Paracoccaceae bacterium]